MQTIKNTQLPQLEEYVNRQQPKLNEFFIAYENGKSDEKPSDFWKKMTSKGVFNQLKKHLLDYQGAICCYCGGRITLKEMEVEHFYPKSYPHYVWLMFKIENLFASCATPRKHTVKLSETPLGIANKYSVDINNIFLLVENNGEQEQYSINLNTTLNTGTTLLINDGKHCNNVKDNKEITSFYLGDDNIIELFDFLDDGTIQASDNAQNKNQLNYEINTILGLNNPELTNIRMKLLRSFQQELGNFTTQDVAMQKEYYNSKIDGQYEAYCFLFTYLLSNFSA